MGSTWASYTLLILSAGVALGLAGILKLVATTLSRRRDRYRWTHAPQNSGDRSHSRFSLAINILGLVVVQALFLIPVVTVLRVAASQPLEGRPWQAVVAIVSFCGFLGLGLLYATRKGDLSWDLTLRNRKRHSK